MFILGQMCEVIAAAAGRVRSWASQVHLPPRDLCSVLVSLPVVPVSGYCVAVGDAAL